MNFEEWWEKETGDNENNVIDWKGFCKSAFEAGLHADIHADNSKVITELKEENRQLRNEVQDLRAYCEQIGKIKTGVLKLFEHIVAR